MYVYMLINILHDCANTINLLPDHAIMWEKYRINGLNRAEGTIKYDFRDNSRNTRR